MPRGPPEYTAFLANASDDPGFDRLVISAINFRPLKEISYGGQNPLALVERT